MLGETLKANIPLIVVQTPDPVSVGSVVAFHTGKTPLTLENKFMLANGGKVPPDNTFVVHGKFSSNVDSFSVYIAMLRAGSSCILVNPEAEVHMAFDAGVMEIPPEVLAHELEKNVGLPHEISMLLVEGLEGLTPLEARWLIALVQSSDQKLTLENLRKTRIKQSPPTRGLSPVSTNLDFYVPDSAIDTWIEESGSFLDHSDRRLRPRGLLFKGPPGTGKTMGSKYIAARLGLPLYHLEIGSVKSKYVGESDRLMREALAAADRHAPIVLLIDEVEKVLSFTDNDSGTSGALLGQLLWWLQEHNSPVLTLMTTNNIDMLPPELYRPGRVDQVIDVPPLSNKVVITEFTIACFKTFGIEPTVPLLEEALNNMGAEIQKTCTHAEATAGVITVVKRLEMNKLKKEKGGKKYGSK